MATVKFALIGASSGATIPAASISGDDPSNAYREKAGDIIHTRNGQTISLRSWDYNKTWRIVWPVVESGDLSVLRAFWRLRTFELWPTGVNTLKYEVVWVGDFNPQLIGPGKWSLEATLDATI